LKANEMTLATPIHADDETALNKIGFREGVEFVLGISGKN
jgi:hypothetical protein